MVPDLTSAVTADLSVPLDPFGVVATPDGQWLLVSLSGSPGGIAVVRRGPRTLELAKVLNLDSRPLGLALSRDGRLLVVTDMDGGVYFVDAARAVTGASGAIVGHVRTGDDMTSIEVAFSRDEQRVFVTEERKASVSIVDVGSSGSGGTVLGAVPVDHMPVGITLSPDGAHLFVTSEGTDASPGDDVSGHPSEFLGYPVSANGTLTIINAAHAGGGQLSAVAARIPAGRTPVRVVLSSDAGVAWVSARADDELLAFDTRAMLEGRQPLLAKVPVGTAPVGIALVAEGRLAVVANSDRFGDGSSSHLSVIDTVAALGGRESIVGSIAVGAFPREFALAPDGKTLFLTNFASRSVTAIDVQALVAMTS